MFEKVIVHSGSPRGLSFPVALALHGLAIGAVVGSSVWFPGEPSEPPVPVTFPRITHAAPGGMAAPAAGTQRSARRSGAATSAPLQLRAPVAAPAETSVRDDQPEADNDAADVPGEESSLNGFLGSGRGDGPGDGDQPPEWTGDDIVRPGGAVREPELVRRVEPQYPEAARKARIEGVVILDAVIAASGEVEEVRVIRSAGKLLDDAAAQALRGWIYRPATLNGRAVRVLLTVTVSFRVH
jgi:protein TonB